MKIAIIAVAAGLALSGCQTAKDFFGTDDPCGMAENAYAAFTVIAGDKLSADAKRKAAAGLAAVREQCSDGQIDRVTLAKLVRAYTAALAEYKKETR